MEEREAYLKPEHSPLYPGMPVARWIGAFGARHLALYLIGQRDPRSQPADRVLPPEHFLFRGGEPPNPRGGVERRRPFRPSRPSTPALALPEGAELE